MGKPVNIADYRELARRRLPRAIFDYLDGGAESEAGLARNREALAHLELLPRRLTDVSRRNMSVALFGKRISSPLVIAPTGLNGVLWPNGDVALARAAAAADIPFILSTASNASIEEVADEAGGDLWFQLYVVERSLADGLVERARQAGYRTLVLTVDVPVNGRRERDVRSGFSLPFRYTPRLIIDGIMHPRWSFNLLRYGVPRMGNLEGPEARNAESQAALLRRQMDASYCWDDLKRLREAWPHRLLVKGILHPDDAARCFAIGIDGVIVSNHGARQLDDAPAPVSVLPDIRAAGEGTVLLDGGIRNGSDVVKALGLGAQAVLLGRATLYGLAADGEVGAREVIEMIKADIDRTLALIGCGAIEGLDHSFIRRPPVS